MNVNNCIIYANIQASARRSMENVQSVEEQQQLEQPPLVMSSQQPDSHYDDLINNQSAAPEPAVMNKLFTGDNNVSYT